MTLERYEEKRDFSATREPPAGAPGADAGRRPGAPVFVVQQHAASRLHYDFRLEFGGALKSWAVPKGPSLDNREKRLAVLVEDHPLEYASYEGVIGHGNYGAGQVIVWDAGIYTPDEGGLSWHDRDEAERRMIEGLAAGKLSFTLRGRKLKGSWTLVRTGRGPNDWLLIKHRDAHADRERDVLDDDASVVSGLSIRQLRSGRLPEPSLAADVGTFGKPARMPSTLRPMFAQAVDGPFSSPDWLFEPKLDGFRALAFLEAGAVRLVSRAGKDMTRNFPAIADDLAVLPHERLVIDGEIVALDADGMPDFNLLQHHSGAPLTWHSEHREDAGPVSIAYYPFDLLYLNGRDLRQVPLRQRKRLLGLAVVPCERIRAVAYVEAEGEAFFGVAAQLGIEGIVAKRRDSRYEAGARSRSWLKIKRVLAQEFVIAGYTKGGGERAGSFGAVVLGYHADGVLTYAGRAGSGFTRQTLRSTLAALEPLRTDGCPFAAVPPELDPASVSWVRPELVAQVKFSQWTADGVLRAPVFLGLRPDVQPRAVVREVAVPVASVAAPTAAADARSETADVLEQLARMRRNGHVEIGGQRIAVTNLDKVFWPATPTRAAVTKREVLAYYARAAPHLLPHLRDRPLTLTRYPNGIEGQSFYQKRWEQDLPPFAETVRLFSSAAEGDVDYLVVNNLPTLVWLAQLADLELHPWLSRTAVEPDAAHLRESFTGSKEELRASVLNHPDFIVFDLDPYIYSGSERRGEEPELNERAFSKGAEAALALKELLDQLSLSSFLKTSGKTGLHVYVPIVREYDYGVTRRACELIGRFLLRQRPRDLTMEWSVSKRSGRIFLDHNMNVMGKNMASVYSLRPLPGAPVSVPLRWEELDRVYPSDFTIDTVPARLETVGDLWAGILDAKHDLRRLLEASAEE